MTREQLRAMLPEGTEDSVVTKLLDALHAEIRPYKDASDKAANDLTEKVKAYNDLQTKYEADIKAATDKAAALEFDSKLNGKLKDKGARNLKAARALLDLEALKASEKQDADIDTAIKTLIESEDTAFVFAAQPTGERRNIGAPVKQAPSAAGGVEAAFAALNPGMKIE